jgi:hypothetical protein
MASLSAQGVFGTYSLGPWFNVSNAYLGFRFKIDGEVHYGWARLTVTWNHKFRIGAALTGYAYETDANKPIISGDTGGAKVSHEISSPTSEMLVTSHPNPEASTLGALSLGASGLSIWRRP